MLRVALIGAGRLGQLHAAILSAHPRVKLVYVCDPFEEAAAKVAEKWGATVVGVDRIFAAKDVQAVVIASTTSTHASLLSQAHKANKIVFCEKPISLDFAEAAAAVAQLNKDGKRCMVGFHRRFDPHFARVKEQIEDGSIGSIYQIAISSRTGTPPTDDYIKTSGGLFRDQSIHDFDIARFLLGEEIHTVYAVGACLIEERIGRVGDIDTAMTTLTSKSGRQVHINNGRFTAFGYDQRIEVYGTKAAAFVNNLPCDYTVRATKEGFSTAVPLHSFVERYRPAYEAELDAFVRFAEGEQVAIADQNDGLEAQRLAEAALRSYQIKLPVTIAVSKGDTSSTGIEPQSAVKAA